MNIFSNAMAQEYDNNYYEDRYSEKPNSYSYNYNNEEKYSDYPSQVNKYECQKGPFEGFFVSSVEFCILKTNQALDKDKDRIKDKDNDSINDNVDNCPTTPNRDQSDNDKDGIGNACDPTPNGPVGSAQPIYVVWSDGIEIFLATSTDGGQTFSPAKNISNTAEDSVDPLIAVSGNNVYVVWSEFTNSGRTSLDVFITTSTDGGQTFSPAKNISNSLSVESSVNSIAVSGNNVYVVWREGTFPNGQIFLATSTNAGQTFSPAKNISNTVSNDAANPQIAISGNNVYVVWQQSNGEIFFTTSTNAGQTFSPAKNISNTAAESSEPDIAVSGNNVYVVWIELINSKYEVFLSTSTNAGQTFSTAKNISNTTGASIGPSIEVSANNVYIVWTEADELTQPGEIFFTTSTNAGQTFTTPKNISNSPSEDSAFESIAASGSNIYVIWREGSIFLNEIVITTSTNGGQTFTTPTNISNTAGGGISFNIDIAIDSGQNTTIPTPLQNTTEIWINPNFNPQSFIDVQKVQLFCEAANCASTINTSQKSTYAIIVVGKDPFSAYCEDPGLSPCAYALIEGPSIGQHSNKLFGSIVNQGSPSDRSTNFYLITLEFNGTNLFFTADNHIGCASNLSSCDQFYSTGTKQPLVLEIRKPI
jgi:hypothetical protein